jgi:vacuole morphology and inheritance protein 14
MRCISDGEVEIRLVAERSNDDLLSLVRDTTGNFELKPLLDTLTEELLNKEDVPTKMAALRWINMLMEKRKDGMSAFVHDLLPVLLRTLSDPSDTVVLLDLQVLSRISLAAGMDEAMEVEQEEAQFTLVLNAILQLFANDRNLLETRGSLIIRKLCVLLNAKSVYIRMAEALSSYESSLEGGGTDVATLEFVSTMVQTLNLILLTASELHDLRSILAGSFNSSRRRQKSDSNHVEVFGALFYCWCHNPVSTFSLCLLAQAHDLSFALIKRFSELEVTVGFLMQIDKLVQLLESPIFVHLRLQLLDVDTPYHAPLLKALYGLLMLLPQSDAFRTLNDRLTTACNLRDNLGITPTLGYDSETIVSMKSVNRERLLRRFDSVMMLHREARERQQELTLQQEQQQSAPNTATSNDVVPQQATGSPVSDARGNLLSNGASPPLATRRPLTGSPGQGNPIDVQPNRGVQ